MPRDLWAAVSTVIDGFRNSAEFTPLSEDDLVQTAIDFANEPTAIGFMELLGGLKLPDPHTEPKIRAIANAVAAQEFGPPRARLIADLDAIAAGARPNAIAKRATATASRMLLVPSYDLSGGALRVKHRYLTDELVNVFGYITLLFLDDSRPYGAKLCRCKLDGCGKFFWERRAERGGKPGRSYCSPEHMKAFNDARITDRVRKSREKKRRAKRKGKAK